MDIDRPYIFPEAPDPNITNPKIPKFGSAGMMTSPRHHRPGTACINHFNLDLKLLHCHDVMVFVWYTM